MWKWMLLQIILLQSKYGGILEEDLGLRWVCLGFDENFVFQGHHIGVISQFKCKVVFLFFLCALHNTSNQLGYCCVFHIALQVSH
jgi:hypothetical protein